MGLRVPSEAGFRMVQGASFKYALPEGWTAIETGVGVDLRGPAAGIGAYLSLVADEAGRMSPEKSLRWMLAVLGLGCVDFHVTRELAEAPAADGRVWKLSETTLTHTMQGTIVRACLTCSVCQDGPRHTGVLRAYQAPARIWEDARRWLPHVAAAIQLTDPERMLGHARCGLPPLFSADGIKVATLN